MPCEWSRYPKRWKLIAQEKKAQVNWSCEGCGKLCLQPGEAWIDYLRRVNWSLAQAIVEKPGRYTLTVAHLDQDPGHNAPTNLKALCTVCHLHYDLPFRAGNQLAKRERQGQGNLFDLATPALAGHGRDRNRVQLTLRQVLS